MTRLTPDEQMDSSGSLSGFIEDFNLRNNHGVTRFNTTIVYTINGNDKYFDAEAMITMDGYNNSGELTVLCEEINPKKFPEKFSANWQKMIYIPETGLKIEGIHPTIGKYNVMIVPK